MEESRIKKEDITQFGNMLKKLRLEIGLTQQELGKRIGKSKQWVSELERGNIRLSFEMAVSISSICNTTTDYLLGLIDIQSKNKTTNIVVPNNEYLKSIQTDNLIAEIKCRGYKVFKEV